LLWHWADDFISPPKESMLRIFIALKIHRPQLSLILVSSGKHTDYYTTKDEFHVLLAVYSYSSEELELQMFLCHCVLTNGLNSLLYYCENDTAIEDIFKGFDSSESSSIRAVEKLAYIKSNFGAISYTFTFPEAFGAHLCDCRACVVCQASDKASTWQGGRQSEVQEVFHVTK
jgi:hypothetical protein